MILSNGILVTMLLYILANLLITLILTIKINYYELYIL